MEGLENYVENGIRLDAVVSFDLLLNIFNAHTPLHDGAVIVQGDRLAAASCFLPLTRTAELSKEYGTRHRAALGISEETDAVALVVSEETGRISVANRRRADPRPRLQRAAQHALQAAAHRALPQAGRRG